MKKKNLFIILSGIIAIGVISCIDRNNNEMSNIKNKIKENIILEKTDNVSIPKVIYKSDEELERIILNDANIPFNEVTYFSINKDYMEAFGKNYYEIKFTYKNIDYTYIISPVDGSIISPINKLNVSNDMIEIK